MEHSEQAGVKRHARRADRPGQPLVWAGDPAAWEEVRRPPRPALLCPEPGCTVELVSYQNDRNTVHQRFFKYKPGRSRCRHWTVHSDGGGGPVTPRHVWLQNRLASIARHLGYAVTCEHPTTRADVFVHEPAFCLEVQLRPTAFAKRTRARQSKGAKVCWLIGDDVNTPVAKNGLFGHPSVRVRVVHKEDRTKILTPWDNPQDRDLDRRSRIQVFATVASCVKRASTGPTSSEYWFESRPMDGYTFLKEVLADQRTWVPPERVGRSIGLWVLKTDLETFDNWCHARQKLAMTTTVRLTDHQKPTSVAESTEDPSAHTPPPQAFEPTTLTPSVAGGGPPSVSQPLSPVPSPPIPMIDEEPRPVPKQRWWQNWRHRPG